MYSETRFRYVVGDIQGCYASLCRLLEHCHFDPAQDCLWIAGDMINRGPRNVEVLRYLRSLGEHCQCVLGNHDFFLLAVVAGATRYDACDTIEDILQAPDCQDLVDWVRHRPLIHVEGSAVMAHAGILPHWSVDQAVRLAAEVEQQLRGPGWKDFLCGIWGGKPTRWDDALQGADRFRLIVNSFCRMRFLQSDGCLAFKPKGRPEDTPDFTPWFKFPRTGLGDYTVYHGHWSALGFRDMGNVVSLDSGCVWGGKLTAMRIEDHQLFQVDSADKDLPENWA